MKFNKPASTRPKRRLKRAAMAVVLSAGPVVSVAVVAPSAVAAPADSDWKCDNAYSEGPFALDHLCAQALGHKLDFHGISYRVFADWNTVWYGQVHLGVWTIVGHKEYRSAETGEITAYSEGVGGYLPLEWKLPDRGAWCVRLIPAPSYPAWPHPICGTVHA